jgi:hypothetical protein
MVDGVPFSAGACEIDNWTDPGTPEAKRFFVGSRWTVERAEGQEDVEVYIFGSQRGDGSR